MAAREEQETTISMGRMDAYMDIWSNNIVHVRKLEKEERAVRVSPDPEMPEDDFAAWLDAGFGAEYRVDAEDASILTVFKRKRAPMSDEQRKAAGERLRAAKK